MTTVNTVAWIAAGAYVLYKLVQTIKAIREAKLAADREIKAIRERNPRPAPSVGACPRPARDAP
jgi:hypothetical protein